MSAQGDKYRNRPEEDPTTRRTAEDELMRGDRDADKTGGRTGGGSGTGGAGLENEGTGSLLVNDGGGRREDDRPESAAGGDEGSGSGSTKEARAPGVSGQRGVTGGMEKEGEGHSGPIRSGSDRKKRSETDQDRATDGNEEDNAREGYEDHGSGRDAGGTRGESSGSRPGYR